MATILVEVLGSAKQFKAEMAEVSASAERSSGAMAGMGKAAFVAGAALAAGIAVGVTKSVEAATKFQSSMELIATQAHAPQAEVKRMSDAVLNLAAKVATSPDSLAQGLYHLESAGLRGQKALKALTIAAEGAQVGHANLEDVTNALNATIVSGIKGSTDMAGAMGTLNATVGAGDMRMQDLADAMGTGLLAKAKVFGVTIQQVGGALATFGDNNIRGAKAATDLSSAIRLMGAPSKAAAKELKTVGVSGTELGDALRHGGPVEALTDLKKHLEAAGLSATEQASVLTRAFGGKQAGGILLLLGQLDRLKKKTREITDESKRFGADWKKTQQTAAFATARFHAAIAALEIRIGASLLPTVTRFTNWLTAELPTAIAAAQGLIKDLTPAFDKVRDAIEAVGSKLGDAISVFESMKGHSDALKAALAVVAIGIGAITTATIAMNFAFLANPIVLVIAGLAALAAGLVLAYQNSEKFRNIVNEAFSAVKSAASASLGYITGTLIPLAIAEWQKFGPQVATAIQGAVSAVQQGMADIKAAIVTVLDFVKGHWNDIWSALGPIVTGVLQVIKTSVQTTLNVIADVVRGFSDLLHGRWGDAWGELKHVVSDVLNGIVSMVGSILTALATSAGNLAVLVGKAIAAGIKKAAQFLIGLAGDLGGKIKAALSQLAGQAAGWAEGIGKAIYNGVLSGLGDIKSAVLSKIPFVGGGSPPRGTGRGQGPGAGSSSGGSKPSGSAGLHTSAYEGIGAPPDMTPQGRLMAMQLFQGFESGVPLLEAGVATSLIDLQHKSEAQIRDAGSTIGPAFAKWREGPLKAFDGLEVPVKGQIEHIAEQLKGATKKELPGIISNFKAWAEEGKKTFDAMAQQTLTSLASAFAKGKAEIDKWKAKLTPAEMQVQANAAKAAFESVKQAVTASQAILDGLQAKQDATWAKLITDQDKNMATLIANMKKNMDAMKAAQGGVQTNASIAKFELSKDKGTQETDPLANQLLTAQMHLDEIKKAFAAGTAGQQDLWAAQQAFDDASTAAVDDTNAQKLLSDYNTWNGLNDQAVAGAQAILDQQATDDQALLDQQNTDAQARADARDGFNAEWDTATKTHQDALAGLSDYYLGQEAIRQRTARDNEATALNTHLDARYTRIKTHLDNVVTATDNNFDTLKRMATKSGGKIIDNIGDAMSDAAKDGQPLQVALVKVSELIKKYLKTNSPTELGPLSDLDKWWNGFAPALISGLDTKMITSSISGALNPTLATGMGGGYGSAAPTMRTTAAGGGDTHLHFNHTPADADPVAIASSVAWQMRLLRS